MIVVKQALIGFWAVVFCPGIALAGGLPSVASPWAASDQAQTRLIGAADTVMPGTMTLNLGWQVELANGWKTYWRDPGEAGLPPRFDWSGSNNVASVEVRWPMPVRYSLYGIETAVYQSRVVLPLAVTLKEPGKAATVSLAVEYMVCKEVCVPLAASYSLSLPAGAKAQESQEYYLIKAYAASVPTADQAQFSVRKLEFDSVTSALLVDLQLSKPNRKVADIFVAGPNTVAFGRAVPMAGDTGLYQIAVRGKKAMDRLSGQEITLNVADDGGDGYAWTGAVAMPACLDPSMPGC